jgi:hypothetical protein
MTHSSSQTQIADPDPDAPFRPRKGRGIRFATHLLPAAIVGALMLDIVTGVAGGIAAIMVALFAPGWLLWKSVRTRMDNDPPSLPALWLVLSFTVLSPAIGGMTFFGWATLVLESYLLISLIILGLVAARVPTPRVAPWGPVGAGLAATALGAVLFRALTWHDSDDDLSYLGFMRRIADEGAFPQTNPFLAGELPLAQRWRLDGWTGLSGALSRLGNADPVNVYMDILPALLILVGASALFILARSLSGDLRFAYIAAFSGLLVPLMTSVATSGGRKTDFKYWYRSLAQNKYAALIVFLPVVAALLVAAYRSRHRVTAIAAATTLWAMLFVHPVPAVFAVAVFSLFVVADLVLNRSGDWKAALAFSAIMLLPLIVTAAAVSFTGDSFGTRLGDVDDISEVAYVAHDFGPIEILLPSKPEVKSADTSQAAAVFIGGHALNKGPRIALLSNGLPLAHWRMLGNPANLIVVLAVALILLGRHRDPVAVWILGATLAAISVFVLPPLAAIVARFITPWNLWRFSWLMPVPLGAAWLIGHWLQRTKWKMSGAAAVAVVLTVVFMASNHANLFRTGPSKSEDRVQAAVAELDGLDGILLGEGPVKEWAISTYADLDAVSYRGLATTSNGFPASRRVEALQRFQDTRNFYSKATSPADRLAILERNSVDLVLIANDDVALIDPGSLGLQHVKPIGRDDVLYVRPGTETP